MKSSDRLINKVFEEIWNKLNEEESSSDSSHILGLNILNYFPFSELPKGKEGADWQKGVDGWGKVYLPSLDTADAQMQIVSKDDIIGSQYQGPKMLHKFSGYIDSFEKKFGEEPKFVIDPSKPWYSKVEIVNPKFLEWKEEYSKGKQTYLDSVGTTNESLKIRKAVRALFESVWTSKDWDKVLQQKKSSNNNSHEISKLKNSIKNYIESKSISNGMSVEVVMDMAKKILSDVGEYELIDVIKSVLTEIERENDEIDPTIRNRANKLYDEIDSTFEMVNEIEIVDDSELEYYDYAEEEREHFNKEYFDKELRDELEAAEEESNSSSDTDI